MALQKWLQVAKERFSYPLRAGLARSWQARKNDGRPSRPGALVADAQELDRPIRDGDPESRANGSFD
jgi:hypothetical protein